MYLRYTTRKKDGKLWKAYIQLTQAEAALEDQIEYAEDNQKADQKNDDNDP